MAVNRRTVGILIDRGVLEDFLVFDATTQSDHHLQAEITSNPIESNNGNVTDHRRIKPASYAFTAIFVDEADPSAPADRAASSRRGFNIARAGSGNDALASARANGPQIQSRALESVNFLRELFATSDVVKVTTEVEVIENAVLETLSYKVLASIPNQSGFTPEPAVFEVTGSFREVRFATTEIVEVPKDPVKRKAGRTIEFGTAVAEPTSSATKDQAQSIMSVGFGGSVVPGG